MVEPEKASPFLTAEWRHLMMLNYEIDPVVLQPFVPNGTEIDDWEGRTYCSVVGFLFLKTRVLGFPIPFHQDFEEVNLRFYVRYKGKEGWRRGVVFIKELVPRFAIAWTARVFYNENYQSLPMGHRLEFGEGGAEGTGTLEYSWRFQSEIHRMLATILGDPVPLAEGSEQQFIAEHYWGYAAQKDGATLEYRVEHPPWRVYRAESAELGADIESLYGKVFTEFIGPNPDSAFVAEGSPVTVYRGQPIAR